MLDIELRPYETNNFGHLLTSKQHFRPSLQASRRLVKRFGNNPTSKSMRDAILPRNGKRQKSRDGKDTRLK